MYQIFFKIYLFLQKHLPNLYELRTWHEKMIFWHSFRCFFIRSLATETHWRPPSFRLVLLWIQTMWGLEKSRQAVVHSAVRCQSTFQSVSDHVPDRVWWVTGSQMGPLYLSFWVYSWRHHSGQISKTIALYDTGRGEFPPHKSEVETERTLVVNRHPGAWLI
jgi:hypothetical protein